MRGIPLVVVELLWCPDDAPRAGLAVQDVQAFALDDGKVEEAVIRAFTMPLVMK
ncbi:MAG: hypothetical protein H6559_18975 [Lewinellaceae bacterium]|nr:hypothetical protein [Lewinellaceae bacterium]